MAKMTTTPRLQAPSRALRGASDQSVRPNRRWSIGTTVDSAACTTVKAGKTSKQRMVLRMPNSWTASGRVGIEPAIH